MFIYQLTQKIQKSRFSACCLLIAFVNVQNSPWFYSGWLEANEASSLPLSPFQSICSYPQTLLSPYLFRFPEGECCWAGWEPQAEVEQGRHLRRALCTQPHGRDTSAAQGGPDIPGKGWRLQLMGVFPHFSPMVYDSHISLSGNVTHQHLSPTSSKYL